MHNIFSLQFTHMQLSISQQNHKIDITFIIFFSPNFFRNTSQIYLAFPPHSLSSVSFNFFYISLWLLQCSFSQYLPLASHPSLFSKRPLLDPTLECHLRRKASMRLRHFLFVSIGEEALRVRTFLLFWLTNNACGTLPRPMLNQQMYHDDGRDIIATC